MKPSAADPSSMRDFTPERWKQIEQVLDAAFEVEPREWPALLERLCRDDPALRREAESLLRRQGQAQAFLEAPIAEIAVPDTKPADGGSSLAGLRLGPYQVVSEIARGGMGRVLLAERADGQFEQRVAIKLLLAGLTTEEAIGRFRAERQILATLAHPSIARLIDGGINDGSPFLVMEFVEGEAIDRYCERNRLPIEDRLRLFLKVAEAIDYAHRNLIVHRDLKPSNIYITREGQVKLLDFGIAKLLGEEAMPELAPRTIAGRRWMTPEYAAPEQIRGEPVTTATDVYQLGVVLYELLTGRRPFERNGGGLYALEEAVLTREPEKPSTVAAATTRRSKSAAAATDLTPGGPARATNGGRGDRILRGDLDAIVLKALRKEPLARYASARSLAGDIESYLKGLPVAARRGTTLYRTKKFVRRHRWGVGMAAGLVLLLAGYAVTATVQSARVREALARTQIEAAKAEQVSDFLMALFKAGDADEATGQDVTARELLKRGVARADELSDQPEVQAQMLIVIGDAYQNWGLYDQAQPLLERSLALRQQVLGEEHEDVAESLNELGTLLHYRGDYEAAEPLLERAVAMRRKVLGEEHGEVARSMVDLARVLAKRGHYERAERLQREALAMRRRVLGDEHLWVAVSLSDLGLLTWRRGDLDAAEPLFREVLAIERKALGEEHWYIANDMTNLGRVLTDQGKGAAAESLLVASLAMKQKLLGDDHPSIPPTLVALGTLSRKTGDFERAESLFREALQRGRAAFGSTHPSVASALVGLAQTQLDQREAAPAEPLLREALEIHQRATPDDRRSIAEIKSQLGRCLTLLRRYGEAEPLLVQSHRALVSEYGETDRRAQEARQYLVDLFMAQGRIAEPEAQIPLVERESTE